MGTIIWNRIGNHKSQIMGSYPYPSNGIIKLNYEHILIFRKQGEQSKTSKDIKELSKLSPDEWKEYFNWIWKIEPIRNKKHSATFPEEIPHRLIKMYSFVNDLILDPFVGSGTTMKVSNKLNRNSIGIEINDDYCGMIKNYFDSII